MTIVGCSGHLDSLRKMELYIGMSSTVPRLLVGCNIEQNLRKNRVQPNTYVTPIHLCCTLRRPHVGPC
jgi:hypothetical protein